MIQLEASWKNILESEFEKPYMQDIRSFLVTQIKQGVTIYPHPKNIFYALNHTALDDVKVVILGQDPYHGAGQAHGLSFSVPDGVKVPPSLKNIYKELGVERDSGDLTAWADQGVLLLNAILSVEASKPASHSKIGWENFTDEIIRQISERRSGVVFLLWGNFARQKKTLIDTDKHLILEAAHPSPFSAHSGFFGCDHFNRANQYLREQDKTEIEW